MVVDDMKQIRRSHLEGKGVQELPSKRRPRLLNRRFEYSCISQFIQWYRRSEISDRHESQGYPKAHETRSKSSLSQLAKIVCEFPIDGLKALFESLFSVWIPARLH
jgi:hypothetical protein